MCGVCNVKNETVKEEDFNELLPIIQHLNIIDVKKIGEESYLIWEWVKKQYLKNIAYQKMINKDLLESTEANLYNFSYAKAISFNTKVKVIRNAKVTDFKKDIDQLASVYFQTFQAAENHQIKHITQTINTLTGKEKLIEYVAEMNNTRPTHAKLNGVVLPSTHPFWTNTAIKALGEWNCNCFLEDSITDQITDIPQIELKDLKNPSNLDIEKGKAIMFKEDVSYFRDVNHIQRRRFKKEGF